MILSFHPIIEAHENIVCAGREPNADDLAAIQRADAVILPQGCPEALYRMARHNCANIFPNMDTRYDYPGKCGQIRLFREVKIAHPDTEIFYNTADYTQRAIKIHLPAVIKLNWGGQGDTVFKARDPESLAEVLDKIKTIEKSGQTGFLVQEFIPSTNRSLRVVLIDDTAISYWRIQKCPAQFGDSVAKGASIDHGLDPDLQSEACKVARRFGRTTGLQLAGFDFLFAEGSLKTGRIEPLMLEINYYFGRTGLGGSERFYKLLIQATDNWLRRLGLQRPQGKS